VTIDPSRKAAEMLLFVIVPVILAGCSSSRTPAAQQSVDALEQPGSSQTLVKKASLSRDVEVVRATGIIQALEWQSLRVPQMSGVGSLEIVLTKLAPNGSKVSKGDVLIEFDRLTLLDQERDAKALLENLAHQLEERKAQVLSLQATRGSQIRESQADLDRSQLQLRKGPVLSNLDRLKNEAKAEDAKARLDSLRKSDVLRVNAEQASVRILELKLERQRVTLERVRANLDRLIIKAPQNGMISYETTWRQGSMGPPQVGDRMYPGMPVMRIFNPNRMVVLTTVDEPDFAAVSTASRAKVYLDAYPSESFDATLRTASPVATAGLDSPVRNFMVTFGIEQQSANLLPDLSAALEIQRTPPNQSHSPQTADAKSSPKVTP
jgi:multidrug resistance efflux pump